MYSNLCLRYMRRSLDRCGRRAGHRGKHASIDAVINEKATQAGRAMKYRATAKGQLAQLRGKAKERVS
jgi:hypothetical protein